MRWVVCLSRINPVWRISYAEMALPVFAFSWLLVVVVVLSRATLPDVMVIATVVLLLCAATLRLRKLRPALLGCIVALVSLALALHHLHGRQLQLSQISTDLLLHVRISDVPTRTAFGLRFSADVLSCDSCNGPLGSQNVLLSWYGHSQTLRAGEYWAMTVRLKPVRSLRNPGSFDRAQWSLAKRLDAQGYVRNKPVATRLAAASRWDIAALRENLSDNLRHSPSATKQVALVEALTLGIKSGIDQDTWELLRDTGTSHLMAISGLHVMLLAGWAFWFARKALSCIPCGWSHTCTPRVLLDRHSGALCMGFLVALGYAVIAGFGLPVQRAVIMLLVWVVASWRFRSLSPVTGLSLAMVAVLAFNVFSPLSPGLWLSFGTVAAIFYLHRGYQPDASVDPAAGSGHEAPVRTKLSRLWRRLVAALRTHLLLGIGLLPVTAWFFQSGSLAAPLANLIAVPFVGFVVVPLCFVAVLTSALLGDGADYVLVVAQWSIDLLTLFLQKIALLEYSAVTLSLPHPGVMLLCMLGTVVCFSPRGCGLRWFAIPLILPAVLFNFHRSPIDGFEVHVLDVGQGLSALVLTDSETLLFDTGGKLNSTTSMFDVVVMPYLHTLGRKRIDTLVVSHGDEDHAFGVDDVMRRFPDARLVVGSGLPEEQQSIAESCVAGMVWSIDNVHFSIVHPGAADQGSDNDLSCVLLVHYGRSRALLTGDIEQGAEKNLARRLGKFPVDLLIAPHHGSKTSSTATLISLLAPDNVVFPAGAANRYGFPHSAVQLRYTLSGARLFTTGMVGAVSFHFSRTGLLGQPVTWWQTRRRFWHGFINPVCSELFAGRALVLRELELAQKGQSLCGK